ncbi:MAG: hypothetical protein JNL72_15760 [Flavipsychrobacter sp.]|nr:hypothetical protein [Flavipsychrobacter sp.]
MKMHLVKFPLVCAALLFGSVLSFAQSKPPVVISSSSDSVKKAAVIKPKVKRPKPISKELSGGLRLNTDGWSVFVERGTVKSEERESDYYYNLRYILVELSEKKHGKEMKSTGSGGGGTESPQSYIFGKTNNFYTFKLGYGGRRMIAGKPDPGTVSIHWINNGGLSIGMLKPYYLLVNSGESIKFTDDTRGDFLSGFNVIGAAGFGEGLGETKVIPGLHFRSGLHFDFAPRDKKKTKLALETGITGELYTQKIELMANQKAVTYFVNLYLSFQFGRRWE